MVKLRTKLRCEPSERCVPLHWRQSETASEREHHCGWGVLHSTQSLLSPLQGVVRAIEHQDKGSLSSEVGRDRDGGVSDPDRVQMGLQQRAGIDISCMLGRRSPQRRVEDLETRLNSFIHCGGDATAGQVNECSGGSEQREDLPRGVRRACHTRTPCPPNVGCSRECRTD